MGIEEVKAKVREGSQYIEKTNFDDMVSGLEAAAPVRVSEPLGELLLAVTRLQHTDETHHVSILKAGLDIGDAFEMIEELAFGAEEGSTLLQIKEGALAAAGSSLMALQHEEHLEGNLANLQAMLEDLATTTAKYETIYSELVDLVKEGADMRGALLQKTQTYIEGLGT